MDLIEQTQARARLRRMLADGSARRIRERAGVGQAALSEELGMQRHAVLRWETRKTSPRDIAVVVRYLELLDALAAIGQDQDEGAPLAMTAAAAG